ncbi:uncharacterized protein B0H18DRAFT_62392 [Fomitopsis serialis]|uniref:uncharacterized protein n=1 Tax=Fomitopsis serialis TaxID=139415 RepID=UPI0020084DB4|nr:uncharacterized protein B0H18DRAFT_380196 [Neoantrodia serialis]XP_047887841.1 uncharacterized protein B0H18DRAFT_62392 [Neoantrodia serialis]KAH9911245.1 hypothetical protein B0H18DRAFT_380196 [Neoantrodia serialis]KAH9916684.1 hypothetical protein B0H18DRAFT_62392 [Neoantrodia serialis]
MLVMPTSPPARASSPPSHSFTRPLARAHPLSPPSSARPRSLTHSPLAQPRLPHLLLTRSSVGCGRRVSQSVHQDDRTETNPTKTAPTGSLGSSTTRGVSSPPTGLTARPSTSSSGAHSLREPREAAPPPPVPHGLVRRLGVLCGLPAPHPVDAAPHRRAALGQGVRPEVRDVNEDEVYAPDRPQHTAHGPTSIEELATYGYRSRTDAHWYDSGQFAVHSVPKPGTTAQRAGL